MAKIIFTRGASKHHRSTAVIAAKRLTIPLVTTGKIRARMLEPKNVRKAAMQRRPHIVLGTIATPRGMKRVRMSNRGRSVLTGSLPTTEVVVPSIIAVCTAEGKKLSCMGMRSEAIAAGTEVRDTRKVIVEAGTKTKKAVIPLESAGST